MGMSSLTISKPTQPDSKVSPYSPLITLLLENRGIMDPDAQEIFLNPDYERDLHDPLLLKDMKIAVARFLKAIEKDEKIIVYSDYDTDGIPGGVILHDFFEEIGYKNFENYIPNRNSEGYGLHKAALDQFAKNGASVVITIDCGISNNKEVAHANKLGLDVIITDHHIPHETLPPAYAVINPQRKDDTYPFKMLCGAGVAFKFVCALIKEGKNKNMFALVPGWEKWLLDMAGIATISDMVELRGENRALAYFGLKVLRCGRRSGLLELLRRARVDHRFLSEDDVGFVIGPRINAASRLDIPDKAFELLATKDISYAGHLAEELHVLNDKRKGIVASVVKEAKQRLSRIEVGRVVVMGNIEWLPGILGLAANHLAGEYECSVFLWGEDENGVIKGSCRSYGGVHMVELMGHAGDLFIDFGGHEGAGGFSALKSKLHLLEDALYKAHKKIEKKEVITSGHVDGTLSLSQVTWDTYRDIEQLAPFGIGNPHPTFLFENIVVHEVNMFGKRGEHIMVKMKDVSGRVVSAIQFFIKKQDKEYVLEQKGYPITFTARVERNIFRGRIELRLRIVELKLCKK